MTISGPKAATAVSRETLEAAKWAGTSRLVAIMNQVVSRGPNNTFAWKPLLQRCHVILDSFKSKHVAQILVHMTKCPVNDQGLIHRFKLKSLKNINDCDALACGGLIYGFDRLGACDADLLQGFKRQVLTQLNTAQEPLPLLLLLNVYAKAKDADACTALLNRIGQLSHLLTPKATAMALVSIIRHFGDNAQVLNAGKFLIGKASHQLGDMDPLAIVRLSTMRTSGLGAEFSQVADVKMAASHKRNLLKIKMG